MRTALLMLVVLLAGCGSLREWWRPDGNYAAFPKDRFECLRASSSTSVAGYGGAIVGGPTTDDQLFIACMEARGYTLRWK